MNHVQPGVLMPPTRLARHLFFSPGASSSPGDALRALCTVADGENTVVGLGASLVLALGRSIEGLRVFPGFTGAGFEVPSTSCALWCWLRGDDRGELVHRTRLMERTVMPAFRLEKVIDAFQYGPSLDLTGYEDGTENPKGDKAFEVAVVRGKGEGIDGSSFVAVQQWVHDLDGFEAMPASEQDNAIGRHKEGNEEIEDAPPSAHVKRTAQESFKPEAFILRRSMPWADEKGAGLVFVAFGRSFDAFEALLHRMVGAEDGISDALFKFTRAISGSYFWCPPVIDGKLDLRALGL
ncbi:MAG: Dyp-type peroxidase [Terriglobia bacterium]|jgi:putative iron-dependent peroxidase